MLNVGPTGEGRIPEASAEILRRVGAWLDRNGTAIYGTTRSPIGEQAWGVATVSGSTLYLHVLQWPRSGKLVVPGIRAAEMNGRAAAAGSVATRGGVATKGSVLATGQAIQIEAVDEGILVHLPKEAPELPITVIAIKFGASGFTGTVKTGGTGSAGTAGGQSHYFHPGLANLFRAPFAELSNARHGKKQWMEKFGDWHHAEVVEGFAGGSSARWGFTSLGRELCNVYLTYECLPDGDGSELEINIGGAGFAFPLQCTGTDFGKRSRFRTECLGVAEIPKAGPFTLELKGLDIKGTDAIRLEEVRLEPVE
jgi:alpha-L-fucosidase